MAALYFAHKRCGIFPDDGMKASLSEHPRGTKKARHLQQHPKSILPIIILDTQETQRLFAIVDPIDP